MNGSAHTTSTALDIHLKRGPAGLGFNIVGGVDQQYVMNDSGIYVAKIKENGAAAQDGQLQEGDKILAINGHELENLSHTAAVDLFRSAGEDVHLRVLKRPPLSANGPASSRPDGESSSPFMTNAVITVALVAGLAFILYKGLGAYRRRF
ncbi:synaptojanin-2-binding protein [Brachyhypopomus gauderio]|uniref:synaptojanin-2-binding protein n=1 Tax=Brachyhypopomus gauderio TaxID=698409 RepID=UPI0040427547